MNAARVVKTSVRLMKANRTTGMGAGFQATKDSTKDTGGTVQEGGSTGGGSAPKGGGGSTPGGKIQS